MSESAALKVHRDEDLQPAHAGGDHSAARVSHEIGAHHAVFWLFVMCLTGVDYFSTLGYQPSIAWEASGKLAPLATGVIVLMTIIGALPVYCRVARLSSDGSGSIGMIERMAEGGWLMKLIVLTLLGAAATDFIITITLSAADAAAHLVENPRWADLIQLASGLTLRTAFPVGIVGGTLLMLLFGWRRTVSCVAALGCGYAMLRVAGELSKDGQQMLITQCLVFALGVVFWIGFREAIGIAVGLVIAYMGLNAIINGAGALYVFRHPEIISEWWNDVTTGNWHVHTSHLPFGAGGGIIMAMVTSLLLFPKLALGLSGFETGVAVMPLIKGGADDKPDMPIGRILATRKLLICAAVIMSMMLIGSSITVTGLVSPESFEAGVSPTAKDRALAFIAHGQTGLDLCPLFGPVFGTLYDISTVLILWFAGASAKAGLINLVPKYLPRHGMAPEWTRAHRPLVVTFTVIAMVVTFIFNASVSAQGDAYATGVLILMSSACIAVSLYIASERKKHRAVGWKRVLQVAELTYFRLITVVFVYTTVTVIVEKPVGLMITGFFTATTFVVAFASRILRSRELRFTEFQFEDETARMLWGNLCTDELYRYVIPHRPNGRTLAEKEREVRKRHNIKEGCPIVFLEVQRGDPSQFINSPVLSIAFDGEDRVIIRAKEAASISHTIAAIAREMSKTSPVELIFGWSEGNPLYLTLEFVVFGEGNVADRVRFLLANMKFKEDRRPMVTIAG